MIRRIAAREQRHMKHILRSVDNTQKEMQEMPNESESGAQVDSNADLKNQSKRRWDSVKRDGANLVINRKSLNVESNKMKHDKIRVENERFLGKL